MNLFHATSSTHLDQIMAEGLRSPCLSTCEESLEYYAEEAAEDAGGRGIILEIDLPESLEQHLRVDFPSFEEPLRCAWSRWAGSEDEFHEMLSGTSEISWPTDERDWKTSLRVVRSVRYLGTVPPEHIRVRD